MDAKKPATEKRLSRREALKRLGGGAAVLGAGLAGGATPGQGAASESEAGGVGKFAGQPQGSALAPQFASRSVVKLPLV